ncbi:MAG: exonuclease SbcCD subunit D, partial [Gemmatimonadota bacterium]
GEGNLLVLGRGGEWERWTLESGGVPVLHVDGWSFPEGHWPDDPTAGYDPAALGETRGAPLIGLVHGDLDQPGSPYGPLSGARLRSLAPAAWVLGHEHVPRLDESPGLAPILYPGSLQALDPGETGARGAWIVELGSGRRPTFRRVRLSSVRYDRVDVSVEGVEDVPGLHAAVRRALQRHLDELAEESGPLRVVHCRVRLTGRTSLHGRIERALEGLGDLQPANEAGLRLVVDPRPIVDTRPALDLESLARGSDAPALLAKLLLELDGPGPSGLPEGLAELAAHAAVEAAGRSHYLTAGLEPLDLSVGSSRLHEGVRRQAARLLDVLTSQKEGA